MMNKPISVNEAELLVLRHLFQPETEEAALEHCTGRILAETICADRDFPPFNRVAMDGIAIKFDSWNSGLKTFLISGIQSAGEPAHTLDDINGCIEVMTGAVLPIGSDTVIRYEDLNQIEDQFEVTINDVRKGQNIHNRGLDQKEGDNLIPEGKLIGPAEIGILATVGKSEVKVKKQPRIAIISTGNELVDVDQNPKPHQIRKSNVHVLLSILKRLQLNAQAFHLNDDLDEIRAELPKLLKEFDVLLLSGAVSKGKFDHLPNVLVENGVWPVFHGVQQRPGKPFWFGCSNETVVFAFPGNPVSTTVCALRYFRPWYFKSMELKTEERAARLGVDVEFKPSLTFFAPVELRTTKDGIEAIPHLGHGSGDLANLVHADGFIELPESESIHRSGSVYKVHRW